MDEKLKATLLKIKQLSEQNEEFASEMRKMFGKTSPAQVVYKDDKVELDVAAIREALEIRANKSVSYDFVREQRLRDQLIIDNLRMENSALNLQQTEEERFYSFCVNGFYQLENIINYYFHITFPEIKKLVEVIVEYTKQEPNEYYRYKPTGREKNVGDIQIVYKISAFCNIIFPGDIIKLTTGQLRQVRNEGEHRCMIIQQERDENNNLYKFFKNNTFNSVRILLIKIVTAVKENIGKSFTATISAMLPSACYIKYDGKTELLPQKMHSKVKGKKPGDIITLIMSNNEIIDVKTE